MKTFGVVLIITYTGSHWHTKKQKIPESKRQKYPDLLSSRNINKIDGFWNCLKERERENKKASLLYVYVVNTSGIKIQWLCNIGKIDKV